VPPWDDGVITDGELFELEHTVERALNSGDLSELSLLGEGEITLVLRGGTEGAWACKRLPPFATGDAAGRYAATIDRYVGELRRRGVDVLDTDVRRIAGAPIGGRETTVVYCVQPVLPPRTQAVDVACDDPDGAPTLLADIVEVVLSTVDPTAGLDAQLSNWAVVDGRLTYFDVTTPLLRRPDGTTELDTEVFLASMPWALRPPVRRFVVPGIIERYHDPRTVALDLASNLLKEGLDELVPAVLTATEGRVAVPLTLEEVRSDRRSDARTWAALQAVRRVDRAWQRHIRRRSYPFLLPSRSSS
jgi:Family of unknown function (DUF6206)